MKIILIVFKHFSLFLIPWLVPLLASGQKDTSEITNRFDNYRQNVLHEKIFVHTDKSFYLAGEIVWFKLYIVDGTYHKPLNISKIAYVELLDNENKPVLQAKVAIKNGSGNGSFYLPVSVNSGSFKFRAYTNWMKNFSPDFYFEKNINIVNTLKAPSGISHPKLEQYDIQFFPEGGNMVRDIQSKIAFRIVNSKGQGINFTGIVINEKNEEVAKFQPLKFGLGNFLFRPESGHTYKAIIRIEGKPDIKKDLPRIYNQGYVMRVSENGNETFTLKIQTNQILQSSSDQIVFLFVHTRQMIKIARKIAMNKGISSVIINKNEMGEGISHLTLFDPNLQPVCERLFFNRPKQKLELEVKSNIREYTTRKKVNLEILSRNAGGAAEPADLSVSVFKLDSLQTIESGNIYNYLWLCSDLRGNIESPDYYFSDKGKLIDDAVDNLMLTQGWSRFRWDDILQNQTPEFNFLPEYEGHIITGTIKDTRTNQPAGDVLTFLTIPGNHFQLYNSTSNSKGQLFFYTHDFYKSGEIIFQTACEADTFYRWEINKAFSNNFSPTSFPEFKPNKAFQKEILEKTIGMQAQNIFTGKAINLFRVQKKDSLTFYGNPDLTYLLDDYVRFGTMEEVIREFVDGVTLHKRKNSFYLRVVNNQQHAPFDSEPLVLLDGIKVCDFNKVIEYDPLLIKKIEIVNQKYYNGTLEYSGLISFTTYKGNYADLKMDPNVLVLDYEGLQRQREFFSPVYETDNQLTSRVPDFRNCLFWSPEVKTNALGKTQISFYTSDRQGEYVIVVQGITEKGSAGYQVRTFIVKNQIRD